MASARKRVGAISPSVVRYLEETRPALLKRIRRRLRRSHRVYVAAEHEDLVQDTHLCVILRRPGPARLSRGSSLAFFSAVARRCLRNSLRKAQRQHHAFGAVIDLEKLRGSPLEPATTERAEEEILVTREAIAQLHHAMEALADDDQKLLNLRYKQGFTLREIGDQMELSHVAVFNKLNSALEHLRRQLRGFNPSNG